MTSPDPQTVARLVTLVHVSQQGSLSGAARVLGVSTSAVSQQMSALAADCGTELFDRQPRGVVLTGAGLALLEHAEQLVRHLDRTATTMSQLSDSLAGPVRIASIASAAASIVLPTAHALRSSAPDVTLSVTTLEPAASLEAVERGTVDVALIDVYDHVPLALPAHLVVEELLREPLVVVARRGTISSRSVALGTLAGHRWVLPPSEAACGAATRHACRAAGFDPTVSWQTDDLLLLVAAVSRGEGIALLPRRAVSDSVASVALHRLVDPVLERRILVVGRPSTLERPTVRALLDALHHVVRHVPAKTAAR